MDLTEATHLNYSLSQRHPWETARFNVICKLIKHHFSDILIKPTSILDLGCGDTFIIENLSSVFPLTEFYAVDIAFSESYMSDIKLKYKHKPINISNSLNIVNKSVDLVLLLDVIEHIENEVDFLKDLLQNSFITHNTYFLITVPAYNSLYTSHDVFLKHFRRYNNKLLNQNLNSAGLISIDSGYFFSSLLFPRIFKKLQEKFFDVKVKNEEGIGNWNKKTLTTAFIKNYLLADFYFTDLIHKTGINIPGLSNFAVCKKSV